jgi:hypothetical protein
MGTTGTIFYVNIQRFCFTFVNMQLFKMLKFLGIHLIGSRYHLGESICAFSKFNLTKDIRRKYLEGHDIHEKIPQFISLSLSSHHLWLFTCLLESSAVDPTHTVAF